MNEYTPVKTISWIHGPQRQFKRRGIIGRIKDYFSPLFFTDGGYFVCVDEDGKSTVSDDGITWNAK